MCTRQVDSLRECDTMEAKMMLFEIKKLIGKVFAEEFAIFGVKLSFLTNIPLQTHLKTVFKSVYGLCQFVKFNPLLI